MIRKLAALLAVLATLALAGCGYNDLQRQDEAIKAAWSEVLNQYQRRSDLIPNLVNTVKGFAQQEQAVFTQVTEARARATSSPCCRPTPGPETFVSWKTSSAKSFSCARDTR